MIPDRRPARAPLTLAQRSNLLPVTAALYDAWRVRSLGLLTGEAYGLERETALMLAWLGVRPGDRCLDVGTSTGNYARALAGAGAGVVAVDLSRPMLERARTLGGSANISYELANAEALPYESGSFDAVAVGASLNEFHGTNAGLRECARVLRPGGKLFLMYLCRASSPPGRLVQAVFALSGVRFPDREAVRTTLAAAGLERRRAELRSAVALELFEKVEGRREGEAPRARPLGVVPGKRQRGPLPDPDGG